MTAEIIPFPIDRNIYFVRETARVLERRHGEAADRFWKLTCRRLYARLQVQGHADAAIRKEIEAFSDAVQMEMQRAAYAAREANTPKGAA
ncbi:DUF6074 family protein [Rhizobium sp. NXC24]|uniref:DUF6074 family protein n=1 Tax=Rhizobium sp. NXC24 TaxID=2048897 RepID=UPI000CDF455A|nr:DUF6074 family protein [Rhizobium sp. NXC24]AVA22487.1 hypothetical protein NXC24_CH02858 [Rhizobium sp. NXC24]